MRFSNKILLAATLALLPACTREPQGPFRFGSLENPLLLNLRVENKEENTIQAGSASDGALLKAKEYTGDEQQLSKLKAKMEFSVKTAFASFRSSYPGTISKTVSCSPALLPRKIENPATGATGFLMKANARLNFGVCDPQEIRFDMIYFVIRCGEKRSYEVKAYRPASDKQEPGMRELFLAFRCSP